MNAVKLWLNILPLVAAHTYIHTYVCVYACVVVVMQTTRVKWVELDKLKANSVKFAVHA